MGCTRSDVIRAAVDRAIVDVKCFGVDILR